MTSKIQIFCLALNGTFENSFPIHIDTNETIGDIRRAIKREKNYERPADELILWKVNIIPPDDARSLEAVIDAKYIEDIKKEKLFPYHFVSHYFHDSSNIIRIIVQEPEVTGKCIQLTIQIFTS
jgi:hypothetical protein